ncbi:MAG: hypothetical protein ACLU4J_11090 [Butyricimonas paravirosa]
MGCERDACCLSTGGTGEKAVTAYDLFKPLTKDEYGRFKYAEKLILLRYHGLMESGEPGGE